MEGDICKYQWQGNQGERFIPNPIFKGLVYIYAAYDSGYTSGISWIGDGLKPYPGLLRCPVRLVFSPHILGCTVSSGWVLSPRGVLLAVVGPSSLTPWCVSRWRSMRTDICSTAYRPWKTRRSPTSSANVSITLLLSAWGVLRSVKCLRMGEGSRPVLAHTTAV